ncbi:tRNA uridine-5-carboxymethylaminomethyl(34) synthesis GTPase MnmE [Candidatus Uabimicrobium amorphum]|uniref:tRNA modification GTPase MnmE n=1 Tax=Uabimicrobium amorphum TaxID=2596890 RepID=A0A5S9IIQ1_UABAM|nr:tRNA uridine-5-carboxymethylaminomethyl(34) synthesis GTPase MnmE [Candidatus Uabimicrobium amorphum]BBM81780.1 tRNA modification GTPase MnmE [Candidatus Uabimicrobium amorphum]
MNNSTIVAVSSTSGESYRGVIRISGPEAFTITSKFTVEEIKPQKHKWCQSDLLIEQWQMNIPVILYLMKAPFSYTSENIIEIHTFSSPVLLDIIVQQFIMGGCQPAQPGEFTKRAFLSGKMDLTQAEAVAEIIAAKTTAERKSAFLGMTGQLSRQIEEMQAVILNVVALMEAHIDFSDEEIDPLPADYVLENLQPVFDLLCSFHKKNKEVSLHGIQLCICGAPNAGKSTFFNLIVEKNQALVSDVSGTTLDWVEDYIVIDGIRFNVIDTPGLEDKAVDLQHKAQKKGRDILRNCDIALFILDSSTPYKEVYEQLFAIIPHETPLAILYNKVDLPSQIDQQIFMDKCDTIFSTSFTTTQNLDTIKSWLVAKAEQIKQNKNEILLNTRQHFAVKQTATILEQVIDDLKNATSYEFIVGDLRLSLDYLGEIVGKVTTEDILGEIFSKFCIGK